MADNGASQPLGFFEPNKSYVESGTPVTDFGMYVHQTENTIETDKDETFEITRQAIYVVNGTNVGFLPIHYFLMRGRDIDCGPITYRSWLVTGSPDTTGAQYLGPKCGASPLAEIIIEAEWIL